MGDPVVVIKLAGNIMYNIPGVKDCSIELSDDNGVSWKTTNIAIDRLAVAATTAERVTVDVL